MSTRNGLKRRKIVVLGSRSVGKSSLILQFIENNFLENYYPTIENSLHKTVKHNGVDFDCEIIDTAGQDEFSIFNSKHAIGIHGYILVYSITSRNSFNMIQPLYERIIDFRGTEDIPCVIVGSKTDLDNNRQVHPADGENLALQTHAAWIESSAKHNINVAEVFDLCLAEIEKRSPANATQEFAGPDKRSSTCRLM